MGRERGLVRFMSTRIICPSLLESRPNTMTTLTTANNEGCRVISPPPPPPLFRSLFLSSFHKSFTGMERKNVLAEQFKKIQQLLLLLN